MDNSSARKSKKSNPWSLRIDLPVVRENMQDENGITIHAIGPEQVAKLCQDMMQSAVEMFTVVDLNSKNRVIDRRVVSMGILDASLVHPREVFWGAIKNMAAKIVLVHNHPSGDPTPSAEDIRLTRQLIEAGKILGIEAIDHVIIGRKGATYPDSPAFLSMRESGVVSF